jgi:acyl dehydratase
VDVADFVRYAGASGDFSRIHYDPAVAKLAGAGSVFGQGMFSAGLLATYLSAWVGREQIGRLRFRFVDRLWPGDDLVVNGRCVSVFQQGGRIEAVLEASLTAGDGATKAQVSCQLSAPAA